MWIGDNLQRRQHIAPARGECGLTMLAMKTSRYGQLFQREELMRFPCIIFLRCKQFNDDQAP